jgi:hypothetical protein
MRTFEEITNQADYLSRATSRKILDSLEEGDYLTTDLRKIVLDAVNDFKRGIVRYIYEIDG